MNKQAECYQRDLLELSHEDIEACYGSFNDIDKLDSFGDTLLLAACKNKQEDNVKLYLSLGANPDYVNGCGESPLHEIIDTVMENEDASLKIAQILLDAGANIEQRAYMDKTPFLRACGRDSLKMLELLVQNGCNPNATVTEYDATIGAKFFADTFNLKPELKAFIKHACNS